MIAGPSNTNKTASSARPRNTKATATERELENEDGAKDAHHDQDGVPDELHGRDGADLDAGSDAHDLDLDADAEELRGAGLDRGTETPDLSGDEKLDLDIDAQGLEGPSISPKKTMLLKATRTTPSSTMTRDVEVRDAHGGREDTAEHVACDALE